ncbi:hypothetical protein BDR22DRAFT_825841 [Usnea florida]
MPPPPNPPYELLYWPTIPGRGEHIRLCFEATSTPYLDTCNHPTPTTAPLTPHLSATNTGTPTSPPPFAPPILRHGSILLSQTPNILLYLAPKLGLAGAPNANDDNNGVAMYHINQLALTALDGLSDEAHDTHHPVAVGAYYEEQKEEARRRAKDYIENRLPKFLGYFERVLKGQEDCGRQHRREEGGGGGDEGVWLYGDRLTYADLVLWQCVDGVSFAFPRAVGRMRGSGEFGRVFGLCRRVGEVEGVRRYLESGRRLEYGMGIYRFYPELDEGGEEGV